MVEIQNHYRPANAKAYDLLDAKVKESLASSPDKRDKQVMPDEFLDEEL